MGDHSGGQPSLLSCHYTRRGTLPVMVNTNRIALWPGSAVGSNMHGQPPSITVMPCWWPYSAAAGVTLDLVRVRVHRENLVAPLPQPPVDCIAAVSLRLPRDAGDGDALARQKLSRGLFDGLHLTPPPARFEAPCGIHRSGP